MTIYEQKKIAKKCGCLTCKGILLNIESSLRWWITAKNKDDKRYASRNYRYFIELLFESNGNPRKHTIGAMGAEKLSGSI